MDKIKIGIILCESLKQVCTEEHVKETKYSFAFSKKKKTNTLSIKLNSKGPENVDYIFLT